MSDLKSCPFCGGTDVSLTDGGYDCPAYHTCNDCGASGPYDIDTDIAWNRRAPQWQPIETAPHDGTVILLSGKAGLNMVCGFWESDGWLMFPNLANISLDSVYFWQPLPEPPKVTP